MANKPSDPRCRTLIDVTAMLDIATPLTLTGKYTISMNVNEIMTREVVTCTADETLAHALAKMHQHRINGLVVVSEREPRTVVGILTENDVFRAALPTEAEVLGDETIFLFPDQFKEYVAEHLRQRVGDVMATRLVSVTPDTAVVVAGAKMVDQRIKQLPVIEDGQLVGIIAISDITHAFE